MITSTSLLSLSQVAILNRTTACFCKNFSLRDSVCILSLHLTRAYSQNIPKMTEKPDWKEEKKRILQLPLEEKRKLYKNSNFITVQRVDTWRLYSVKNKEVVERKVTRDDVNEYQKYKFNPDLDKSLAEKVSIFKGDITTLEVDAIVNAANSALRAGGGVDGAIHRAAGRLLQEECNTLGRCPTGHAKITGGYKLPAKYVIQTVGPQDGDSGALQSCYERSLALLQEHHLKSIAFPCISTGIYGFPNRKAAHIALKTARSFLEKNDEVERIIFCLFMPIDVEIYETLMQMYFPLHAWNYNDGASLTE